MSEEPAEHGSDEEGELLPLPPALPGPPFTAEEATALLDEVVVMFDDPHAALEELLECDGQVFDDVEELLGGKLSQEEFAVLMPILIQVSFAFAPPGTLQPELDLDKMEAMLPGVLASRGREMIAASRQPHLLEAVLGCLQECNQGVPAEERLKGEKLALAEGVLRVVVDGFDAAMRAEGAAR